MARYSTFREHSAAHRHSEDGAGRGGLLGSRRARAAAGMALCAAALVAVTTAGLGLARRPAIVLLPLEQKPDVADTYKAGVEDNDGGVEERAQMRDFYSTLDRTDRDRLHEHELHKQQDEWFKTGKAAPMGALGGPTATSRRGPPGGGTAAWYADWWNGMKVSPLVQGLEDMTGTGSARNKGRERLIDAGINVQGWEPGRSRRQVVRDQKSGKDIPKGFWDANGEPVFEPDTAVHHPCGSPLRKRPCTPEEEEAMMDAVAAGGVADESKVDTAWHAVNGTLDEPLWKDPVPMHVLVSAHIANRERMHREAFEKAQKEKQLEDARRGGQSSDEGQGDDALGLGDQEAAEDAEKA